MIAWFEEPHVAAHFVHDAHRFMPKRQILSWANSTAHGMGVRGTDEGIGRLDDGIVWTRLGNGFLHEPHLADRFHYKRFHARSSLCFAKTGCVHAVNLRMQERGAQHISKGRPVGIERCAAV